MLHCRSAFLVLAAGIFACADSPTAPAASRDAQSLSPLDYARQLSGDPFLLRVATRAGRPDAPPTIDAAIACLERSFVDHTNLACASAAGTRLTAPGRLGEESAPSEEDVLAAVFEVTLRQLDTLRTTGGTLPDER
jgi:hypothetical protein